MKKLAIVLAALVSGSAFAASTEIISDGHSSQEQAYNAGFELAETLESLSHNKLERTLRVPSTSVIYNSISIKNVEVKVEEYSKQKGQIQYRALLDINYDYDES